jgi:putative holliday junction resolvase
MQPSTTTPRPGCYVGLDVGRVRIGVALSDPDTGFGHAGFVLDRKGTRRDVEAIIHWLDGRAIAGAVIGLPPTSDDPKRCSARMAREFARRWVEQTGIAAVLVDESDSTIEASANLSALGAKGPRLRARVDAEAAAIILNRFAAGWPAQAAPTQQAQSLTPGPMADG